MITWDVGDEVVITDGVFLGATPLIDRFVGQVRGVVVYSGSHETGVKMEDGSLLSVPNMALARF